MASDEWTGWTRAILLIDMNAFFASIEQMDHPHWRKRPVAVTNGENGSCIITCSYEARAYGIGTGMRMKEAKHLCPHLVQAPSRPARYAGISRAIMAALKSITPDQEIFSVDECFLDVSRCHAVYPNPLAAAKRAKEVVYEASGLLCSVGLSGDKTTAKYAAKRQKPDGLTVIPPWRAAAELAPEPVDVLCGIGPGISRFLAHHGVVYCGDMVRLPMGVLARRFGNLGRRIWLMCQGLDPEPVSGVIADPQSIGHGKVLPPGCRNMAIIQSYLYRMCLKVAARLRAHRMVAKHFYIGIKSQSWGWLGGRYALAVPDNDGVAIYRLALQCCHTYGEHGVVRQVQVTALSPHHQAMQADLFDEVSPHQQQMNALLDAVNERFGSGALLPASLVQAPASVDVIAPAWRPDGCRDSIDPVKHGAHKH